MQFSVSEPKGGGIGASLLEDRLEIMAEASKVDIVQRISQLAKVSMFMNASLGSKAAEMQYPWESLIIPRQEQPL